MGTAIETVGSVYIFKRGDDDQFVQTSVLEGEANTGKLGYDVAIDGETVVVGAPHDSTNGMKPARLYGLGASAAAPTMAPVRVSAKTTPAAKCATGPPPVAMG